MREFTLSYCSIADTSSDWVNLALYCSDVSECVSVWVCECECVSVWESVCVSVWVTILNVQYYLAAWMTLCPVSCSIWTFCSCFFLQPVLSDTWTGVNCILLATTDLEMTPCSKHEICSTSRSMDAIDIVARLFQCWSHVSELDSHNHSDYSTLVTPWSLATRSFFRFPQTHPTWQNIFGLNTIFCCS